MVNEQYLRYEKQFKLDCILKVLASGLSLLAIIFFMFLPNFCIKFMGIEVERFSIFDEALKSVSSMSEGVTSLSSVVSIWQVAALLFVALGIVTSVISFVKNILNLTDIKNYSLEKYDEIKKGTGKKSILGRFNSTNSFICAVIMESGYIILAKSFSAIPSVEFSGGYLAEVNGVTGLISLFIICTVGFIAITAFCKLQFRKVKHDVLREDYRVS